MVGLDLGPQEWIKEIRGRRTEGFYCYGVWGTRELNKFQRAFLESELAEQKTYMVLSADLVILLLEIYLK